MIPIIRGNIETINQAQDLLDSLDEESYCHICSPHMSSSIGQHIRHIIDNYLVLVEGMPNKHIDYNGRRRGAKVETCLDTAKAELKQLQHWLLSVNQDFLDSSITIISEVCLQEEQSERINSNLHRELLFVASHCIHHMALIGVAVKLQNRETPKFFGLAPATATYVRQQELINAVNS
ncbi:DinB family protein [Marinomonas algicola]|uniref:DinB family protein n=1 Tax=Marinomonas algicola TaxID=2773454 RepID=UPI00174813C9|nr:DinB family protein [Marinomonas algicola]